MIGSQKHNFEQKEPDSEYILSDYIKINSEANKINPWCVKSGECSGFSGDTEIGDFCSAANVFFLFFLI